MRSPFLLLCSSSSNSSPIKQSSSVSFALPMRRNCSLGNRLPPPPPSLPIQNSLITNSINPQEAMNFYGGGPGGGEGISNVCDMTELQVRALILLARRESEERLMNSFPYSDEPISPPPLPVSTLLFQQLNSAPPPGTSMKRSLQGFLQRRKNRILQSSSSSSSSS